MASQLPENTAPAGYQCPSCQGPVFPPANLVSPVASSLREKLSTVNWARAGLGLPLIEEPEHIEELEPQDTTDYTDWSSFNSTSGHSSEEHVSQAVQSSYYSASPSHSTQQAANGGGAKEEVHSVINMNNVGNAAFNTDSTPRKVYDTRDGGNNTDTLIDFDDDKYRRRPALSWFAQLLKNRSGSKKRPASKMQRCLVILVIGVIGFLTLILIMSKFGRASADNDPNLNPLLNPHIRIGQK